MTKYYIFHPYLAGNIALFYFAERIMQALEHEFFTTINLTFFCRISY